MRKRRKFGLEQALDKPTHRVSLTGTTRANDRDAIVKRLFGKAAQQHSFPYIARMNDAAL